MGAHSIYMKQEIIVWMTEDENLEICNMYVKGLIKNESSKKYVCLSY